jgi:hypothetical protein
MAKQSKQPEIRAVRVELPADKHTELRVLAARAGKPMSQYVRDLVLEVINRQSKTR